MDKNSVNQIHNRSYHLSGLRYYCTKIYRGFTPIGRVLWSSTNHNCNSPKTQLWDDDAKELERLGWSTSCDFYPNGGVFFLKKSAYVTNLFDSWHTKWLENINKTGRTRDQPSLYSAITEADMPITLLPHEYNYQDVHFQGPSNRSKIVHYYGNYSSLDNPRESLLIYTNT